MDTSELQQRFGAVIRQLRLQARLGQESLAHQAGLHRTHLSSLERGRQMPSLGVIHKLAEALGTTMAAILTQVESEDPIATAPELPRGRPPRLDASKETVLESEEE